MFKRLVSRIRTHFSNPLVECKACLRIRRRAEMYRVPGIGPFCSAAEFHAWTHRNW